MFHKLRTTLGGAGFYAVLFLCLASVGTGAYFLLFRDAQPETALPASSAESTIVSEVPESDVTPEVPVVETVQPQPVTETDTDSAGGGEVSAASEEPAVEDVPAVNTAPVIPEAPSLVVSPLRGQVVAAFSVDALTYNSTRDDWRTHDGVDIAAAAGTNVLAASAGTVLSVFQDDLLGTTVVLFTLICAQVAMKVLVGAGEEKPAAQVSEAEPVADIDAALKRGCAAVAQQNALTQREEEVLFLLAHGRSARYIADELVI